jgi:hypothetical protein
MFRPHLDAGMGTRLHLATHGSRRCERLVDEIVPVAAATRCTSRASSREGGHLRRHVERCDARGRAHDREPRARGHEHRLHAPGYGRALSVDAALRRRRRGDERGRARDLPLHARLSLRSACACPLPSARIEAQPVAAGSDTERFVDELIAKEPVVLFALEWCEFCWSVRKLFATLGVSFRSIDIDFVAYQANDRRRKGPRRRR